MNFGDAWDQAMHAVGYPVFEAEYRGTCAECGGDIEIGDGCAYNNDDEVVHEGCL